MIIDFHTHCYTDELAKRATSRIPKELNNGPYFDGTLLGLIRTMKNANIDYAVALNVASRPDTVKNVNDWAIRCSQESMLIPFGAVHPNGNYEDELLRLKDNGIKGIKVHPHYQGFLVNDITALKMYEKILKNGFIALFHCGLDAMIRQEFCTPVLFRDVISNFEGEKIVAAHLGGTGYFDDCIKYIYGKDIYLDTSIAYKYTDESFRKQLFALHNNDKILFGSDMPWAEPYSAIEDIKKTVLNQDLSEKILYKNAKALLGI